jgi:hypothetical protein
MYVKPLILTSLMHVIVVNFCDMRAKFYKVLWLEAS